MLPRSATLAALEGRLRPALVRMPPSAALRLYSRGRRLFLDRLVRERPRRIGVSEELSRTLWGVHFRAPLCNAAGMFKNGDGYDMAARQGAGAWLAGTTTHTPRRGNRRRGVTMPFAPYPGSGAASNWLGLPNPGHAAVARIVARLRRVEGCPVGVSLATDPASEPGPKAETEQALDDLIAGLELYADAGVDFVEINESCPNTEASGEGETFDDLVERLRYLADSFVERRGASLPVLVKFSTDTDVVQVADLVGALRGLGYAGVNFGNTSTDYAGLRDEIRDRERCLYDAFVERYGGGVSGRPLAPRSMTLVAAAVAAVAAARDDEADTGSEFHVVRTGGIEDAAGVAASESLGASLCQWYTGYFEAFSRAGHRVYQRLYEELAEFPSVAT